MKNNKIQRKSQAINMILISIIFLWLALLTKFVFDSRDLHFIQAKNDSEAIYQTMVEQGKLRSRIDELDKQ